MGEIDFNDYLPLPCPITSCNKHKLNIIIIILLTNNFDLIIDNNIYVSTITTL